MQIEFPDSAPQYSAHNLTLSFVAKVDGAPISCAISVEALEDHFGAKGSHADACLHAFHAGRTLIESVARHHLMLSNGSPILLKSGHFPPGSAFAVYRKPWIHARPV